MVKYYLVVQEFEVLVIDVHYPRVGDYLIYGDDRTCYRVTEIHWFPKNVKRRGLFQKSEPRVEVIHIVKDAQS